MTQNMGQFEEDIFKDDQAIPLSDQEAFLIMQKAKETALEGQNKGDHPLLRNQEFQDFLKYQEKLMGKEDHYMIDQFSKDAQLLRERFNQLQDLNNAEIALFLNLRPQTVDEALSLIPSLKRYNRDKAEEVIDRALNIYKNSHLTFKQIYYKTC